MTKTYRLKMQDSCNSVTGRKTFRSTLAQFLACSAKNLVLLSYGMTVGFPTIAIPALQKTTSDLYLNEDQISWFGSINLICVPVGALLCGPILDYVGRRVVMLIDQINFIATWVIYFQADSVAMMYAGVALSGVGGGIMEAPTLTYVTEVTQPHLRGMLASLSVTCLIIGVLIEFVLGNLVDWRMAAAISIASPIATAIALALIPESPPWLLSQGRVEDARKSLCWLRGWVEPEDVEMEFSEMMKSVKAKSGDSPQTWNDRWQEFLKPTVYKPFAIIIVCFLMQHFSGLTIVQTYTVGMFDSLGAPIGSYMATMFLGIAQLVGAVACVIVVHWTGKRRLYLVSTCGVTVCMIAVGTYGYLHETNGTVADWAPLTFLLGFAFFSHLGVRIIHWVLVGEMFPLNVRGYMSGLCAAIGYVFGFVSSKTYVYIVDAIDLSGMYWICAAVGLIVTIFLYIYLPETEGCTMEQVATLYDKKSHSSKKGEPAESPDRN